MTIQDPVGQQVAADEYWSGPDGLENLIAMGIRVMPVVAGQKTPAWKHWAFGRDGRPYSASSATTDLERLAKATATELRPNIGVPTGQPWRGKYLNAIDIDPRHGGDVAFTELCDLIGRPPQTATSRTLNGGSHIYVLSPLPWGDAPKEVAAGVEFKRAGQFVMAPPSNGYSWVVAPYGDLEDGHGISSWGELDSFLGMTVAAGASGLLEPTEEQATATVLPPPESWCSTDDYLRAISSATPGRRTEVLLRMGGKVAWATANGAGLDSPEAVGSALWRACETCGLVDDYAVDELTRKIGVFVVWSDPSRNPLLLSGRTDRKHPPVLPSLLKGLTESRAPARRAVLESLGRFARMEFRPYAASYGSAWTEIPEPTVRRALIWLHDNGLIERGQSVYSGGGKRPTHTYRVTTLGKLALRALREQS